MRAMVITIRSAQLSDIRILGCFTQSFVSFIAQPRLRTPNKLITYETHVRNLLTSYETLTKSH
jgi:hypothetical protein